MPGRVPGQCPAVSLPVTLLLPTWLLRRAGRWLAGSAPALPFVPLPVVPQYWVPAQRHGWQGGQGRQGRHWWPGSSWSRYSRGYSAVRLCPGVAAGLWAGFPHRVGHGTPVPTVPATGYRPGQWGQGHCAQPCLVGPFLCFASTMPQFPSTHLGPFHPAPLPTCMGRYLGVITVTPALQPCGYLSSSSSAWRNHQASERPGFHPGKNGKGGMRHVARQSPLPALPGAPGKRRSCWVLAW